MTEKKWFGKVIDKMPDEDLRYFPTYRPKSKSIKIWFDRVIDRMSLEEARKFYENNGITSVQTFMVKTANGNYVYHHVLNSNSKQESRCFDGLNDCVCENHSIMNYLLRVSEKVVFSNYFLIGKEVKEAYEQSLFLDKKDCFHTEYGLFS